MAASDRDDLKRTVNGCPRQYRDKGSVPEISDD